MEASMPCGNLYSDDIGFKSYVNSPCYSLNLSDAKHQDCTSSVGESAKEMMPQEDVISRGIKRNDNVMVEELAITLDQTQHIQDIQQREFGHISNSDRGEICHPEETCPGLEDNQDLIAKTRKGLSKCATFPCSEFLSSPTSVVERDMTPATSLHGQSSLRSEPPAYLRSMSMPTPLKLISAMKGGREQHGTPMKTKMNVKWAPDVCDPPATSLSHTVKSHHRRPKAKKRDYHKHKHSKGKSTRGSGSEKKQHTNRTILGNGYPSHLRFSIPGGGLLDGFDQAPVEVVDLAVSKQDIKCRSSFLRASLSRMHISVAEAT